MQQIAKPSETATAPAARGRERAAESCEHNIVTATRELGPHCCDCSEPLVGIFNPISRNTPAGAILYAMKTATSGSQQHAG